VLEKDTIMWKTTNQQFTTVIADKITVIPK